MILERMTKGPAKVVGSIMAALLIVAMAAWGIEDFLRVGPGQASLAEIGDTEISSREFDREFRDQINRLQRSFGGNIDPARARQMGVADSTLDGMIDRRLIKLQTDYLGLRVGNATIQEEIRKTKAFQGFGGTFDQGMFAQTLSQAGMSEAQYVQSLRDDLARGFLVEAIRSGSVVPDDLANGLYKYMRQERIADVVSVPRSAVGDVGTPSESEIEAFHKKRSAMFTAPEFRTITAIVLDPDEHAKGLQPSEERVKEEYESRKASLTTPEKRKLEQILFADEKTAKKAEALLKEGRSFASVAKEIAGKDEKSLSLGQMTKRQLATIAPSLADASFALRNPGITDATQTPLGWHIVRVTAIEPAKVPSFASVRKKIEADLNREQAIEQLVEIGAKIEDAVAGGATLEEVAEQTGMKLRKPPPIDRRGFADNGKRAPNIPGGGRFLEVAFKTGEGLVGQLEEIGVGGYFIVSVEKVTPPTLRPLDKVKGEVIKAWKRDKQTEAARKKAQVLLDAVKAGTALKDAAAKQKLKLSTSKPVSRLGGGDKFPSSLIQDLFKLKKDGAAMGLTENGYAAIQLKEIKDPDPKKSKDEMKQLRDGLLSAVGNDLLEQYSLALKERFPVTIDRKAVDAYLDQSTGDGS